MKLPRRKFLHLAAGAAALPAVSRVAWAQAYPTRPVRVIVPFAAGGIGEHPRAPDGTMAVGAARAAICHREPAGCRQQYRHRGGGEVASGRLHAAHGKLDERHQRHALRQAQFQFHPRHRAGRNHQPQHLRHGGASFEPAKTVPEFIAYAKANPGKINIASAGTGGAGHVFGELFKMMTGINTVHVPYRGAAPALADLLAAQVQAYFAPTTASIEYIRAGKLRALAVTTATRSEALPDIPAVNEFVPGYEASGWSGFGSPKGTPTEVIDKLNMEVNAGLADPKIKAQLADLGSPALAGLPADFGKLIADDTEKWGKVIRAANIKAD